MKNKDELLKEIEFHSQRFKYHYDEFMKLRNEVLSRLPPEQKAFFEAHLKEISIPTLKH